MKLNTLILLCIVVLFVLGQNGAYENELFEFQQYCENVFDHNIWPDFKNVGLDSCADHIQQMGE
tara:strand:- start:391 stop:582 length:192 start_codon:yes stop_codon:yes gene_type:complete